MLRNSKKTRKCVICEILVLFFFISPFLLGILRCLIVQPIFFLSFEAVSCIYGITTFSVVASLTVIILVKSRSSVSREALQNGALSRLSITNQINEFNKLFVMVAIFFCLSELTWVVSKGMFFYGAQHAAEQLSKNDRESFCLLNSTVNFLIYCTVFRPFQEFCTDNFIVKWIKKVILKTNSEKQQQTEMVVFHCAINQ